MGERLLLPYSNHLLLYPFQPPLFFQDGSFTSFTEVGLFKRATSNSLPDFYNFLFFIFLNSLTFGDGDLSTHILTSIGSIIAPDVFYRSFTHIHRLKFLYLNLLAALPRPRSKERLEKWLLSTSTSSSFSHFF